MRDVSTWCDVLSKAKAFCFRALAAACRWWTSNRRRKLNVRPFLLGPAASALPRVRVRWHRPSVLIWYPKYKAVPAVGVGEHLCCRPYEEGKRVYLEVKRWSSQVDDGKGGGGRESFPEVLFARMHGSRLDVDVTDAFRMVLGPGRDFHGAELTAQELYYIIAHIQGLPSQPGADVSVTTLVMRPSFPRWTFTGPETVAPST
jgi:hypothetical protein